MTHEYNPFWQQRIRETVLRALDVHPRLTALRVDLRLPDVPAATDAAVISRFINALKARINAYQKRKRREGKRVHPTTLHYAWAREFGELKGKKHYHLLLLVNRDTWCRAGDYRAPRSLAGMIKQAWCSALGWMPGLMPRWRIFLTRRRCGWNAMMTLAFSRCWNVLTIWRRNIPKLTPLVSATLAAVVAEPDRRVI
ncbi:malate transporter [Escherichia coli]|uniref:Malate transporter n=7 Tax=Escherichia coli TaxID=562 RepID=A0A376RAM7_ECOLX|nr:malate transporter [Escherichia coli]